MITRTWNTTACVAAALLSVGLASGCQRETSTSAATDETDRLAERGDRAPGTTAWDSSNTGQAIEDAAITTKVKAALMAEPNLQATDIDVDTMNGVVVLSGSVGTPQAAERAAQVAQGIDGVKSVDNQLTVNQAG